LQWSEWEQVQAESLEVTFYGDLSSGLLESWLKRLSNRINELALNVNSFSSLQSPEVIAAIKMPSIKITCQCDWTKDAVESLDQRLRSQKFVFVGVTEPFMENQFQRDSGWIKGSIR